MNIQFTKKRTIMIAALVIISALFTYFSFAKLVKIDVGPAIGSKAAPFTVLNTAGKTVKIDDFMASKGLIVLFFRSADWCPFCKRHLKELNDYADKYKALGYGVVAISYDTPTILNDFSRKNDLTYPLLSDQAAATIKAYNILNSKYSLGDDNYGIPYPGIVIINPQGNIEHKYFFEGYIKRVKFPELYQQLLSIK